MPSKEDAEDLRVQWLEERRTTPDTASEQIATTRAADAMWGQEQRR